MIEFEDDVRKLLIGQKIDTFFHLLSLCDLLWFFCGTCTRSRISPCISWRFDYNQVLPAS